MNKIITRGYYAFEIFLFLLRRKKLTSNKKAFAIFRLMTFGFLVNFFTNIYLIKKVSKLLNMNKIELTNVEDFRSFITHKNT
jgi:hypothetical protein